MNNCTSIQEKMIVFDELTHDEQKKINQHLDTCPECREKFQQFQSILEALKQRGHIDQDLLVRYALYRADSNTADYDGRKLTKSEIRSITSHISTCQRCQAQIMEIQAEFNEIDSYLETAGVPSVALGKLPMRVILSNQFSHLMHIITSAFQSLTTSQISMIVGFAAAAGILFLLIVNPFSQNNKNYFDQIAYMEKESVPFQTRGSASATLTNGLAAFNDRNYQATIRTLSEFITQTTDSTSLAYASQILGTAYLFNYQQTFLDNAEHASPSDIEQGLMYLEAAIRLTHNARIREDAYWYIGKAYLMQKNKTAAAQTLDQVTQLDGRRKSAAQELLKKIADSN
ncbi:hypothetical protein JW960_03300 [candidate division KSB1 bacterium]|nr:hypothetical protein [candidate division KSB1 bacterium]